jgi:hypothetical protein
MKFKTPSGKPKDIPIHNYLVDFDDEQGSQFSAEVLDFFYPYWNGLSFRITSWPTHISTIRNLILNKSVKISNKSPEAIGRYFKIDPILIT